MGSSSFLFPPFIFLLRSFKRLPGCVLPARVITFVVERLTRRFVVSFYAACLVVVPMLALGDVRINELYYDHPGSDSGHEFFELINSDSLGLALGNYAIEFHNGAGTGWEPVWQAGPFDSIPAGGLFLCGGRYVFPTPDVLLELSLQNGPDAIRLTRSGVTIDLLGYGDLEDPDYVEGLSAPGVSPGSSLAREPDGRDTNNNRSDFHPAEPSPGKYNIPREDVSLGLADRTRAAAVVEAGYSEEIHFVLINRGIEPVDAGAVGIQLWDSSETGQQLTGEATNTTTIPPGLEAGMVFHVRFSEGYHFLRLNAVYAPDERGGNNRLELIRRSGTPPLLISEIMSDPPGSCPQYVELYNAGSETYDVGGCLLRDKSHVFVRVSSESEQLDPGGYLVLTPDSGALLLSFPEMFSPDVVEVEGSWPYFNRSGSGGFADSVIVGDAYRLPVDAVSYPPQPTEARGRSLERVDLFPGSRAPVWILSREPGGGSPGRRCTTSLLEPPSRGTVRISPNPFSPESGEKLLIAVDARNLIDRVVVTVFDMYGRRIKTVGSSTVFPYVFLWDGTGEGSRGSASGLYIVACEYYSDGNGRAGVEKVVVGCGKKSK